MQMEILRTKSPALVCRELLIHIIAYNPIRSGSRNKKPIRSKAA